MSTRPVTSRPSDLEFKERKGDSKRAPAVERQAVVFERPAQTSRAGKLPGPLVRCIAAFVGDKMDVFATASELKTFSCVCRSWSVEAGSLRDLRIIQKCFPGLPRGIGNVRDRYQAWEERMVRNILNGRVPVHVSRGFIQHLMHNETPFSRALFELDGRYILTGENNQLYRRVVFPSSLKLSNGRVFFTQIEGREAKGGMVKVASVVVHNLLYSKEQVIDLPRRRHYLFDTSKDWLVLLNSTLDVPNSDVLELYKLGTEETAPQMLATLQCATPQTFESILCCGKWAFVSGRSNSGQKDEQISITAIFDLEKRTFFKEIRHKTFGAVIETANGLLARIRTSGKFGLVEQIELLDAEDPGTTPLRVIPIDDDDKHMFTPSGVADSNLLPLGKHHSLVLGRKSLSLYNLDTGERRVVIGRDFDTSERNEDGTVERNGFQLSFSSFSLFNGVLTIYNENDSGERNVFIDLTLGLSESEPDFSSMDDEDLLPLLQAAPRLLQEAAPVEQPAEPAPAALEPPAQPLPPPAVERGFFGRIFNGIASCFNWIWECILDCFGM